MKKVFVFALSAIALISLVVTTVYFLPLNQGNFGGFQRPLPIPPLAESSFDGSVRTFDLTMQAGTTEFIDGQEIETWGINGDYLSPTLRVNDGEEIQIRVSNELPEDTTMHWHGLHVPAKMDGGPHQPIEIGGIWAPNWQVSQKASTNWYHPHLHGRSEAHVKAGLVGMFIVDDSEEADLDLPRTYGIDDIPVIVHDAPDALVSTNPFRTAIDELLGGRGAQNLTIVNGELEPYLDVTTSLVRLRLLNGSIGDVFDFSFSDQRDFSIIASEGGLFDAPVSTNSILMSPGERYEILVGFEPGETAVLNRSALSDDNGESTVESTIEFRAAPTLSGATDVPETLVAQTVRDSQQVSGTRTFDMSGVQINGLMMDMNRIDQVVHAGTSEIWSIKNLDRRELHNFHVHGVSFRVLDIGGEAPPAHQVWDKDTVLVPPETTVNLLVTFPEVSGEGWPFMFHCHFLRHEGRGMMGQYLVVNQGESLNPEEHEIASMAGHSH